MIRLLSIGKQLVNSLTCLLKQVLELAKLELKYTYWRTKFI